MAAATHGGEKSSKGKETFSRRDGYIDEKCDLWQILCHHLIFFLSGTGGGFVALMQNCPHEKHLGGSVVSCDGNGKLYNITVNT